MSEADAAPFYIPSAEGTGTFGGYDPSDEDGQAVLGYFQARLSAIATPDGPPGASRARRIPMSDEYSLHTRFLLGMDSAAEYERRRARLHALEAEEEPRLVAWPPPRPEIELPDLVETDPAYRAVYERALASLPLP